jgi:hypothetical protein
MQMLADEASERDVLYCGAECPLLAQSGRPKTINVRFWLEADIGGSGLLPCKLTPEPHFAGRKKNRRKIVVRRELIRGSRVRRRHPDESTQRQKAAVVPFLPGSDRTSFLPRETFSEAFLVSKASAASSGMSLLHLVGTNSPLALPKTAPHASAMASPPLSRKHVDQPTAASLNLASGYPGVTVPDTAAWGWSGIGIWSVSISVVPIWVVIRP